MHELALAGEIRDIISAKCGITRIRTVEIEAGALSGVVPISFSFCTETVLHDAFGKQVQINIHYPQACAACACGKEYMLNDLLMPCPACGKYDRKILSGLDIFLKSVETENDNEKKD